MKYLYKILAIVLLTACFLFAGNNKISPCDEVVINAFGEIFTFSKNRNELQRYKDLVLINSFKDDGLGSKLSLEDPLKPVSEDPDMIHILDMGTRTIITWDRFLNLHAITSLHQTIISPSAFVVTSEHDWLIYDDHREQILQIHSGESYPLSWGNKNYSFGIELFSVQHRVLIHQKYKNILSFSDENGKTLSNHALPDSLKIERIFPLNLNEIVILSSDGLFLWKLPQKSLCYLSNIKNVIHVDNFSTSSLRVITRDGAINYLP